MLAKERAVLANERAVRVYEFRCDERPGLDGEVEGINISCKMKKERSCFMSPSRA